MNVQTLHRDKILEPCGLSMYEFQIDPYIGCQHHCLYCYALNGAQTDWEHEIRIHEDLVPRLRQELDGLSPQGFYLGWNSDPYQPAENRHRQTRQTLELLGSHGSSACILTKSDLASRDIDLLKQMPGSSVGFSFAFQDEETRKIFERQAPPNHQRLAALNAFKQAGIETYVLITPMLPHLTDVEALIDMVSADADTIWLYSLSMISEQDTNWRNVQEIMARDFPDLAASFREIVFSPDHAYWKELRPKLESIQAERGLDLRIGL
ncbi:MAG: radical SAM protein [Anaerolineales bacterium]|jgi:DNA repair photolyase